MLMGSGTHRSHAVHHGGVGRKGFLQSSSGLTYIRTIGLNWTTSLHVALQTCLHYEAILLQNRVAHLGCNSMFFWKQKSQ